MSEHARSVNLSTATGDAAVIARECVVLHEALKIAPVDLRGVGIHISRLVRPEEAVRGRVRVANTSSVRDAFRVASERPPASAPRAAMDALVCRALLRVGREPSGRVSSPEAAPHVAARGASRRGG